MEMTAKRAFLDWYEPVHPAFVRYCSSRAFGTLEVEDLVQEAVLATLEAFHRVKDKSKLLGFMIGVVNNIIRNQARRRKFRGPWEEKLLDTLESYDLDPEVALDVQYLLKAMKTLPAAQEEALLLFEVSGFSLREISEIQQISVGAVKTRLSRARKQLRTLLGEGTGRLSLAKRLAIYASLF